MPEDITRITIRTPKELHDKIMDASYQSRKQGDYKSINSIVIEALEMWVKAHASCGKTPKGEGRGEM
ncbi:MAG: hypothetical protein ACP5SH_27545 [Syntrophobacteraceae bacterium]